MWARCRESKRVSSRVSQLYRQGFSLKKREPENKNSQNQQIFSHIKITFTQGFLIIKKEYPSAADMTYI